MRVVQKILFVVCMSSLMVAQSAPSSGTDTPKAEGDVQKLLEAVTAQQKAIAEQQKQIQEQQVEIERLKAQFAAQAQAVSAGSDAQSARVVNATLTAPNTNPAMRTVSDTAQEEKPKESPLSFRIGGAEFTPGGFMDFTAIFRSVNTGNPGGTNFFAIPFSNTIGGHLTETRFTAQNSRISLKATDKFGKNDVTGYVEMDFLGNDAANVFVTSNSHTLRQRLYFVDVKRDKWEILAGQSWSWLTPNRVGLSPYPSDVFYSQDMDFNYQVGLTWTRAPQFRVAYHPNSNWALGVALENPEQFGGQGELVFPQGNGFNAQLGGQIDQANISSTPNLHPDIIPKIAYDTDVSGKHFHLEAAGLLTGLKITNLSAGTFVKHTKEGAGLEGAVNLEIFKNFRVVANGFWSDGGGRYQFGMGPDLVVLPNAAGNDVFISPVHSYSGILGFETQVTPHTMFYGYYGGDYFQRNFGPDFSVAANAGGFRPNVGFGFPAVVNGLGVTQFGGSANNNNRAIQEGTLGWIQTFWRNPQYGALQLITQASYLTRAPWFVAAGAPKNAHLAMGWVDIRYVLP
jgi:hypothetical protein